MRLSRAVCLVVVGAGLAALQAALLLPAAGAVYSGEQALSVQTIKEFLADPTALLARYPDGGALLIARVRDLAASDPSTLKAIIGLLATANSKQSNAIGAGLGQASLMAVRTDPTYANQIKQAITKIDMSQSGAAGATGATSTQPTIGNAVKVENQVDGVTEIGTAPISKGNHVFSNELVRTGDAAKAELLFLDHTNLTVGPVTEVHLDRFIYDPSGGSGTVVFNASRGAFRFITGLQQHRSYQVKTPYATMGVRGTCFYVVIGANSEKVQLCSGRVIVTTISGQVVSLTDPGQILLIDSYGNTQPQPPTNQPIANFADLGEPVTDSSTTDALAAFEAVVGSTAVGGAGGGGGGGGGTGGSGGGGGGSGGSGPPNLETFSLTQTDNFPTTTLTSGSVSR